MTEQYDTVVLGGSMAGLPLALRAARHGRVAFIEKEKLGGTCMNRGCIPTKTMIASAAVAHQGRRAAEFGVHSGGGSPLTSPRSSTARTGSSAPSGYPQCRVSRYDLNPHCSR